MTTTEGGGSGVAVAVGVEVGVGVGVLGRAVGSSVLGVGVGGADATVTVIAPASSRTAVGVRRDVGVRRGVGVLVGTRSRGERVTQSSYPARVSPCRRMISRAACGGTATVRISGGMTFSALVVPLLMKPVDDSWLMIRPAGPPWPLRTSTTGTASHRSCTAAPANSRSLAGELPSGLSTAMR